MLIQWNTLLIVLFSYNSAIFFVYGPSEYAVVMAPPGPMKRGGTDLWDRCIDTHGLMNKTTLAAEMSRSDLQMLSSEECFDTFTQDFVSGQRLVVLVTNDPMPAGEPVVLMGAGNSGNVTGTRNSNYMWMCGNHACTKEMASKMWDGDAWNIGPGPYVHVQVPTSDGLQSMPGVSDVDTTRSPDLETLSDLLNSYANKEEVQGSLNGAEYWHNTAFPNSVTILGRTSSCSMTQFAPEEYRSRPQNYHIEYCLTVPKEETCQLVFSLPICLVVIACNLVKLICTLFTARDGRDEVLVTTGDAIASYLTYPDRTTEGTCLLSKPLIDKGSQDWHNRPSLLEWKSAIPKGPAASSAHPLQLESRKRWLEAASTARWVLAVEV